MSFTYLLTILFTYYLKNKKCYVLSQKVALIFWNNLNESSSNFKRMVIVWVSEKVSQAIDIIVKDMF